MHLLLLFIPYLPTACPPALISSLPPVLAIGSPLSLRLVPQDECLTLGTGLNLQAQPCMKASCPASLSKLKM